MYIGGILKERKFMASHGLISETSPPNRAGPIFKGVISSITEIQPHLGWIVYAGYGFGYSSVTKTSVLDLGLTLILATDLKKTGTESQWSRKEECGSRDQTGTGAVERG